MTIDSVNLTCPYCQSSQMEYMGDIVNRHRCLNCNFQTTLAYLSRLYGEIELYGKPSQAKQEDKIS